MSLPADAPATEKRKRGFDFERLLNKLLSVDGLEPRTGYKPKGEQIDGSIYLDGRIYLLEAKWHAEPLPASTLYQFKGKVDGKLAGTIGVFVSMSGYAEDAVDALMLGKGLNVVLADRKDINAAILRGDGFKNVLKLKLRKAAEEGAIYFPAEAEVVTAGESRTVAIEALHYDRMTEGIFQMRQAAPDAADLLIVCEGEIDRVVISVLAERILRAARSKRVLKIIVAMGKVTIPRVANAIWRTFNPTTKALVVVDGDNDPEGTRDMLANSLEFDEWIAAIPNPSIEAWLGVDAITIRRSTSPRKRLGHLAENLDIEDLLKRDKEFVKFHDAVTGE